MELLQVMEPVLSGQIIEGDQWIHQIKWDGIRGIISIENGMFRIFTKNGQERTGFYPEIGDVLKLFRGNQTVMDGEMVVFDENAKPSFRLVLTRDRLKKTGNLPIYLKKHPVHYIIFDILFLNGKDLRNLSLEERKLILSRSITQNSHIGITQDFTNGPALFNLMKERNYEGIVSKNKSSIYVPGKKHQFWFKTKIIKKILAVIGGLSSKSGYPNSLLLGVYVDEKLVYIGNASLGLTQKDFAVLKDYSSSLQQRDSSFCNLNQAKNVTWLDPLLTCWVSFLEWTENSNLRHPKILGFSTEKAILANGKEYLVE
ncbi:MAG: Multifunctional non-homologous end joining protein LigD [Candidatus Dichloromethanomonas elyunquensis]|nr:MAG: Multifunctional non-homologous end joining protein LigD [Candidatus Dichloromethanomonas elyunquensis]